MVETKNRNCSIDIFRYICAIMVVAIHAHSFSDISAEFGYIFTQIISRIGVPFFFATAGYFYIQKLEKKQSSFFRYFKRLLITYFVWSCLYYMIDFIGCGYLNPTEFIVNCIFKFIFTGSHYHFWFFPAIIFSVCFTTLIFKIKLNKIVITLSIILYTIGCLGCSYYELGVNIPFLEKLYMFSQFDLIRSVLLMGFPFFICGYLVYKIKEKVFNIVSNKNLLLIWLVVTIIWLIEIYIVRVFKWQANIVITFGLYLLVSATLLILLKFPLLKYKSLAAKSRTLASFTYYSHPFYMFCLSKIASKFFHINLTATAMFILTIFLTHLSGIIIYNLDNKLLNKIVN